MLNAMLVTTRAACFVFTRETNVLVEDGRRDLADNLGSWTLPIEPGLFFDYDFLMK